MLLIILLLILSISTTAQQNFFNKEDEIKKFVERGGKVNEISPNIYKFIYPDGNARVFNFNKSKNLGANNTLMDSTIINVGEIDTTLYADKFKFWQRVDLVSGFETTVPIEDINQNGQVELYGIARNNWPSGGQVDILEQDQQGLFHTIYTYYSTSLFVQGVGDVDSDGIKEVHLRTTDTLNGKFYRADSIGKLPTTFDFVFYYYPIGQINDITFGDFDKNGVTDCAFIDWPITYVATFDSLMNNFTKVFEYSVDDYSSGFAINDFDGDGKTELVFGTSLHTVYVVEAKDTNQYAFVWQGLAPENGAYMVTSTNDIDSNGKPEFWIGGQNFTTEISKFWCYESDGDNIYVPVAEIELRYLVSLYTNYLQSTDIDNDGVDELVINIGNHFLILKFTGKPSQHNYELFYVKINENTQPSAVFFPTTIFDLNRDGKEDILLSLYIYPPPSISYILIQDTPTSVPENDLQKINKFDLSQNYPNPFNPITEIKVTVKTQSNIQVVVYNILGKEIKKLLNENLPTGEYTIQWDGKDHKGNSLPGGVYFIQMKSDNYQHTIKSVLLK